MSGWFDGSGRGTSDAFHGIGAGHRGRRNAQRQRYDRGFGKVMFNNTKSNQNKPGLWPTTTTNYKGHILLTMDLPGFSDMDQHLASWRTQVKKNGIIVHTVRKGSKGFSINSAKDWVDISVASQTTINYQIVGDDLPIFTEPDDDPIIDNSQYVTPFQPTPMPEDFVVAGRTVSAYYSSQAEKYFVTVRQGTAILDSREFHQGQHGLAIAQYNLWKNMVIQRANYDAQESLSVDKGDYRIDLVVTQAASISGFFNGILNVFGLGTTNSSTARHTASVPQNMRRNTTNMAGKSVNLGIAEDPLDSQGYNTPPTSDWKSMPTKTFAVRVRRISPTNVSGLGELPAADVIKDTSYSTYSEAKAAYDTEVATIENNPTHYDDPADPFEGEVPPSNGNGGDTTGDDSSSDNYNEDYVDPGLEQAAAAAAAAAAQAAAEQAAAEAQALAEQAAAEAAFLAASNASAAEQAAAQAAAEVAAAAAAAAAQQQFSEESAASAENYNAMTVDTSVPVYQTQTYQQYTTTVPAATSSSSPLLDNKVLLGAGAVTLVAGAYLLSRRD